MSYTPGPWLDDGNGFEATWDVSNSERSICTVKTTRQDARLIAAAPELLDAVYFILNEMPEPKGMVQHSDDAYRKLKAAIAKATGEKL